MAAKIYKRHYGVNDVDVRRASPVKTGLRRCKVYMSETILMSPFYKPAVVQQEAEQAEQDEANSSQYRQQKHSVVHVEVLRKDGI